MPKQPYTLIYAPAAKKHLLAIGKEHHSLIRDAIVEQLTFEPDVESRNRKPLKRPVVSESEWEIRFGHQNKFRVFYRVKGKSRHVEILAIAVKEGKDIIIGGEKIKS
jgi:mRNA-degrading endonuclease RelE of RelBE toxin-antitoxin system